MKQLMAQNGTVHIEEVPAPYLENDDVLIEVAYSLVSTGSEMYRIKKSIKKKTKQKDLFEPDLEEYDITGESNKNIKDTLAGPLGYSCSGIITEISENIKNFGFSKGDRVACGATGPAYHAELISSKINHLVKIPKGVSLEDAATITPGTIALWGIRRARLALGEIVAVMGLGLTGQIACQILSSMGCRVIAIDLNKARISIAKQLGAEYAVEAESNDTIDRIMAITNKNGVDCTIVAASGSEELLARAASITRNEGRVVFGGPGINQNLRPTLNKNLDLLIASLCGPKEHSSSDYLKETNWTEQRNMQEYIRLLNLKKVSPKKLISKAFEIDDAQNAYRYIEELKPKPLGILIEYPSGMDRWGLKNTSKVEFKSIRVSGKINVALIGAGYRSLKIHLPNLKKLSSLYNLTAVVSRTGAIASEVAKLYGARYASTKYEDVLADSNIDMVLITVRREQHAKMAVSAAHTGKAVYVEKPLAVNHEELQRIEKVFTQNNIPLFTGSNRRYSPALVPIINHLANRETPIMINYKIRTKIVPERMRYRYETGAGPAVVEAGHVFDLFNYLVDSNVVSINAQSLGDGYSKNPLDNFMTSVKYQNGSLCNLIYSTIGPSEAHGEYFEIITEGEIIEVNNFKQLISTGPCDISWKSKKIETGHLEELKVFGQCILGKCEDTIPLSSMISVSKLCLDIDNILRNKQD